MLTQNAYEDSRSSFCPRVRQFAVPPSMIETATARREAGDWAGACAAAGVDVDLDLRSVARAHGPDLTARLRADLRHLAPDLLRWHMPRIAPHGLLRPGLTVSLARYDLDGSDGVRPVHLVVRTPPAWADAGQRISLALWDGSRSEPHAHRHPHPRPGPRFRLDLHRHLWDARRADDLRVRSGADLSPSDAGAGGEPAPGTRESVPLEVREPVPPEVREAVPPELRRAIGRWTAEAGILLRAEGRSTGAFAVRLGGRRRLFLELAGGGDATGPSVLRTAPPPPDGDATSLPVLPDAATWVLPDLELLRTGAIDAGLLHPLVARALLPGRPPAAGPPPVVDGAGRPRVVECRGARHRIGLVDGVLVPLDHDPAEIRREELLVALTGTPLPCLRAIDEAHRRPDCLSGVRERLDHGDVAGALAVVEGLLGPGALLRDGPLPDAPPDWARTVEIG
ncbi:MULTISPECIES: hypothetical protein [unclassified Streptomyces]|uniref:hypothetical protein n=1 Tax=unclassified Streptomyces TaxID=2593676 RepID=UPI0001C18B4E|nr:MULTISPECIES: hypothetical protein [unclassified Streptomyces]AEN09090.1 conserved hypothetical protein [Streptomyces sp. SirexAA-E]MYR68936.1 hypothetical protein [Streptomyces sp. SID4939]MYS01317.1 hypothetical protein [Streptomyces sp. SID4940]MYT62485.1 hypothetical protein [Streptomyces sp. SID8357]MYT85487.1 hypothetical protein [Streptomyces sp. SID8360]